MSKDCLDYTAGKVSLLFNKTNWKLIEIIIGEIDRIKGERIFVMTRTNRIYTGSAR